MSLFEKIGKAIGDAVGGQGDGWSGMQGGSELGHASEGTEESGDGSGDGLLSKARDLAGPLFASGFAGDLLGRAGGEDTNLSSGHHEDGDLRRRDGE